MKKISLSRLLMRSFVAVLLIVALLMISCSSPAPASPTQTSTPTATATSSPTGKPTTTASSAPTTSPSSTASATVGPAAGEKWPDAVSVGTPTSGGGAYFTATALSTLIKKYLNVTASPQVQGGVTGCLNAIALGRMEMAYITSVDTVQAYQGKAAFQGKPIPELRILFGGPISIFLIVVKADSPIKSITDMKGKRVMYKSPGNPAVAKFFEGLLAAYNMTPNDIVPLQWTIDKEISDGLSTGSIDVGVLPGPYAGQAPTILELSQSIPVHILDVPKDKLQWVADNKFDPGTLSVVQYKGGQYKGTDYDVNLLNQLQFMLTTTNLPQSFGYSILKTIWDNHLDEYELMYPNNKLHSAKNTIGITSMPFHSGTIQYYKEKGQWTPEMQQLQDKLLAQAGKK